MPKQEKVKRQIQGGKKVNGEEKINGIFTIFVIE